MSAILRGVGDRAAASALFQEWSEAAARGHHTAVVESWRAARSTLPVNAFAADLEAVEAAGWSLVLTKQWEDYALFRQDLAPCSRNPHLAALLGILDSWRAIHEARYDASLVGVRNVQSALVQETTSRLLAHAHKVEGVALFRLGRYLEAESLTRRALELFRSAGDALHVAHCATNLGLILNARGEIRAAREELRGALAALLQAHAAEERVALARENLAVVETHLGNTDDARALYESALDTFRKLGLRSEQVSALNGLGHCARLLGRFAEAEERHAAALALASTDLARQAGLCHEFLGQIHFDSGVYERAEAHYREALATAAAIAPDGDLMVEASWRYAELLVAQGRPDEALELLERAEALCAQSTDRRELGCVQRVRARWLAAQGQAEPARAAFKTACATLEASGRPFEAVLTQIAQAGVESDTAAGAALLTAARHALAELAPESLWLARLDSALQKLGPESAVEASGEIFARYGFVTGDPELHALLDDLPGIAATPHPLLLEGESGTGKELVARAVHALGRRRGPFVAINCSAIPRDLFESELFGHVRGAFSGAAGDKPGLLEQAADGTLLLDEIGEMPYELQAKLLRFLDDGCLRRLGEVRERRVQVKIVAATNRALMPTVEAGVFRRDLFHRLAVHRLHLKPLRERPGDVALLARFFLEREELADRQALTPELLGELETCSWPGNVRELRNVLIRRATQRREITQSPLDVAHVSGRGGALRESRSAHERRLIETTLRGTSGNVAAAARDLGMHVTTLRRKMRTLGVRRPS